MTATPWGSLEATVIGGGPLGSSFVLRIPSGAGYPIHRHTETETVIYIAEGNGEHTGDGGPAEVSADDTVVLPVGAWHGFRNTGAGTATLLVIFAPGPGFPEEDYEEATPEQQFGEGLPIRKLHEVPTRPDISTPENGFDGFTVNFEGAKGTESVVLGFAKFPPGSTHRWHRHTKAEEAAFVLSGTGFHNCEVERLALEAGKDLWIPRAEWHTFETDPDCPEIDVVWWYMGTDTLDGSGYELRERQEGNVAPA